MSPCWSESDAIATSGTTKKIVSHSPPGRQEAVGRQAGSEFSAHDCVMGSKIDRYCCFSCSFLKAR